MAFDAVVLSGGRGARLGGVVKATLVSGEVPLLLAAVGAAAGARMIVVVGDGAPGLSADVLLARETPPFGGPAAALGAGMGTLALHGEPAELVLVLACDMPRVATAVDVLLAAAASSPALDGVMAVDAEGRRQYLAAVYRSAPLTAALSGHSSLAGLSMRALQLGECQVPAEATRDVDTWADAARFGITEPTA